MCVCVCVCVQMSVAPSGYTDNMKIQYILIGYTEHVTVTF
jgi:hypothetical protein